MILLAWCIIRYLGFCVVIRNIYNFCGQGVLKILSYKIIVVLTLLRLKQFRELRYVSVPDLYLVDYSK